MPQPLSRVRSDAGVIMGNIPDDSLSKRPELAILAMSAINSWSNVEAFLLKLFIVLLGGNATLAAKMYLKLESSGPKIVVLGAMVDSVKKEKLRDTIRAVIDMSEIQRKQRDKLAHHVWGVSPHLPDALLLLDPRANLGDTLDRSKVLSISSRGFP
jgi:hypothetical protein